MAETETSTDAPLRTLIVDDEPLAVERTQVICAELETIRVVGTASDGAAALRLAEKLNLDLVLLDMTMPELDGLGVARKLAESDNPPAVIFVTAHDHFAVEAFDLDAIDYVLKPVSAERLSRAIKRAIARRGERTAESSEWLNELWVPHRSELLRIAVNEVHRIDAERDYVRLHVAAPGEEAAASGESSRTYLLLQTIAGLEARLGREVLLAGSLAGRRHAERASWRP